jgi:hypothetical protein
VRASKLLKSLIGTSRVDSSAQKRSPGKSPLNRLIKKISGASAKLFGIKFSKLMAAISRGKIPPPLRETTAIRYNASGEKVQVPRGLPVLSAAAIRKHIGNDPKLKKAMGKRAEAQKKLESEEKKLRSDPESTSLKENVLAAKKELQRIDGIIKRAVVARVEARSDQIAIPDDLDLETLVEQAIDQHVKASLPPLRPLLKRPKFQKALKNKVQLQGKLNLEKAQLEKEMALLKDIQKILGKAKPTVEGQRIERDQQRKVDLQQQKVADAEKPLKAINKYIEGAKDLYIKALRDRIPDSISAKHRPTTVSKKELKQILKNPKLKKMMKLKEKTENALTEQRKALRTVRRQIRKSGSSTKLKAVESQLDKSVESTKTHLKKINKAIYRHMEAAKVEVRSKRTINIGDLLKKNQSYTKVMKQRAEVKYALESAVKELNEGKKTPQMTERVREATERLVKIDKIIERAVIIRYKKLGASPPADLKKLVRKAIDSHVKAAKKPAVIFENLLENPRVNKALVRKGQKQHELKLKKRALDKINKILKKNPSDTEVKKLRNQQLGEITKLEKYLTGLEPMIDKVISRHFKMVGAKPPSNLNKLKNKLVSAAYTKPK